MRFDGIHHVTCITADAPRNVDFYTARPRAAAREEDRQPGRPDRLPPLLRRRGGDARARTSPSSSTRTRGPAQAGDGMVHTVVWRVGSADALEFWASGLARRATRSRPTASRSASRIPKACAHELVVAQVPDEPLVAHHPEIPREVALQGFEGVRAYGRPDDEFLDGARLRAGGRPLGHARRDAWRLDRVRRGAVRGRGRRRRHRPPRRVGVDDGGPPGLARPCPGGGRPPDADHRSLLVPLDLLPRAGRRPVRDRDARARLRRGRGSRAPRREADPAAGLRAPARPRRAACSRRCPIRGPTGPRGS